MLRSGNYVIIRLRSMAATLIYGLLFLDVSNYLFNGNVLYNNCVECSINVDHAANHIDMI